MKNILTLLILTSIFWFFCSEYNPFENSANVKMQIITTATSIDSDSAASIFSSETLFVAGAVREQIDSFSLSVRNNRAFSDTTIIAPIEIGNYAFPFSFIDTGTFVITLITYRKNGDDITEELNIKVTSPLNQDTVIISEAVKESLYTAPVTDAGVRYYWSFSSVGEEFYTLSQTSNSFNGDITQFDHNGSLGYLWVVDSFGNLSPKSQFIYQFIDSTGPIISSDNDGYNPITSTIVTGDKSFRLKIRCNDLAGINVALVNGKEFSDSEVKSSHEIIYYETFYSVDTITDSIAVTIEASDVLNHLSSKTFYIKYDEAGPKEIFRLISPPAQPYSTASQNFNIQVETINLFNSSMIVTGNHVEGSLLDTLDTLLISDSAKTIQFPVILQPLDNTIIFSAIDSLGNRDTILITLSYSSTSVDENAPFIISAKINGSGTYPAIMNTNFAIFELNAYDDNLDSIYINGDPKNLNQEYLWKDTMDATEDLQHFSVRLVDASGNTTEKEYYFQRNSVPYISESPVWPKTLVVGSSWRDTLTITDNDGDSTTLSHKVRLINQQNSNLQTYNKILNSLVTFKKLSRSRWEVYWSGSNIADSIKGVQIPTNIIIDDLKQKEYVNWDFSIVDSVNAKAFDFTLFLPDKIDTTSEGVIDLSQITDTIILQGTIEGNSQTLSSYDTISLVFETQVVKYTTNTGSFDIIINVGEKEVEEESIIVTVTDTSGFTIVIDTLDIIYEKILSPYLEDEISWFLSVDDIEISRNIVKAVKVDTGTIVKIWESEGITLKANENVEGSYPYHPTLIYDSLLDMEVIRFSRSGKNSFVNTEVNLGADEFTLFVAARLGEKAVKDSSYCLFSASTSWHYTGFGVANGEGAMLGDTTVVLTNALDLRDSYDVFDKDWHIYTVTSSTGITTLNDTSDDNVNIFAASLWIDGVKTDCDSCISVGTPENYPYFVLGGGAKHMVYNGWEGDVVQLIKFDRALSEKEIKEVTDYIASDLKINLNKYKKGIQIQRDY